MADITGLTDEQIGPEAAAGRRSVAMYKQWKEGFDAAKRERIVKFDDGRSYQVVDLGSIKALYVVVCYDPSKYAGILAVKETEAEAEAVERRWTEIVEKIGIERWSIGDELEPEP